MNPLSIGFGMNSSMNSSWNITDNDIRALAKESVAVRMTPWLRPYHRRIKRAMRILRANVAAADAASARRAVAYARCIAVLRLAMRTVRAADFARWESAFERYARSLPRVKIKKAMSRWAASRVAEEHANARREAAGRAAWPAQGVADITQAPADREWADLAMARSKRLNTRFVSAQCRRDAASFEVEDMVHDLAYSAPVAEESPSPPLSPLEPLWAFDALNPAAVF